jgi:asparagine synthase (glutamine-hydrolysing)
MPGIVGLVTRMPRELAEPKLLRMVESISHEPFYNKGTWVDESLGVYVGWVARKDSASDGMPIRSRQGDVVLVFSGEDYPDQLAAPRSSDHAASNHDCGYLVDRYAGGGGFPANLNGRFHGLLIDRTRGTATLFNDRYGMHRLYFHESKDAFLFGAEAKAILAVCPEVRTADPQSVGEFIACGCVMENRTIFRGVTALPSAAAWVFQAGSLQRRDTYFHPREWETEEPMEAEPFYRSLRDAFAANLGRYFTGHNRIGISLTGGLDTRMIMAWRQAAPNSLPCYTFGGMFRDCHDVKVARRVADLCRQPHQVIPVDYEFLSRFAHYAERSMLLAEGGVDMSRSPDLFVSERAREIAPVKIVGTYGSEILRQVPMFKPVEPAAGLFRPEMLSHVYQARATYAEVRREHPVTFAAFRQSPWYHYGVLALEQSQLTVRSPYLDNQLVQLAFRAPKSAVETDEVRLRLIQDGSAALARIPTDRGVGGATGRLTGALSRNLLEFTFKAEYAYDYGMPQWLSRIDHFLSPLCLQSLFLGRHKLFHFRVWYRDAVADYVRQVLLDPRALSRPYLDGKGLEAIVEGHLTGGRNHTTAIHRVLALELLHRLFFDAR